MTVRLRGGSDLRARLSSLGEVGPEFAQAWADDTVKRIRATAPPSKETASKRWTTKATRLRAAVYGAFWWLFVDRGTKAHDIFGSGRKNPPNVLVFDVGGKTVFASKAHHKRSHRRPFISRAAQDALSGSAWTDLIVRRWNKARLASHARFL